jgi:hypothetical protein
VEKIVIVKQDYDINDVFSYLEDWRSNRAIKEKFELSQTRFYSLSRWLVKGGFVERREASSIGLDCNNRITFYRVKK